MLTEIKLRTLGFYYQNIWSPPAAPKGQDCELCPITHDTPTIAVRFCDSKLDLGAYDLAALSHWINNPRENALKEILEPTEPIANQMIGARYFVYIDRQKCPVPPALTEVDVPFDIRRATTQLAADGVSREFVGLAPQASLAALMVEQGRQIHAGHKTLAAIGVISCLAGAAWSMSMYPEAGMAWRALSIAGLTPVAGTMVIAAIGMILTGCLYADILVDAGVYRRFGYCEVDLIMGRIERLP